MDELLKSIETANLSIQESEAKRKTKADQPDLDILRSKKDDLENRSKHNGIMLLSGASKKDLKTTSAQWKNLLRKSYLLITCN